MRLEFGVGDCLVLNKTRRFYVERPYAANNELVRFKSDAIFIVIDIITMKTSDEYAFILRHMAGEKVILYGNEHAKYFRLMV